MAWVTSNISVGTTDTAKTGSSCNLKVLAALAVSGLLVLGGCGGDYQNIKPQNKPPYQKYLAQLQVFAPTGPSIPTGGTVLVSASAVYQVSPNSFTNTDVTSSAAWTTSDPAIATVNNGVVTGTGTGSVTIAAVFGGKSGSTTIFVGMTSYITISPLGPFRLSAGSETDFYATETFSDGSTLDVSGLATWDASPGGIISIYPYFGFATLVAPGTTTITATLNTGEVGSAEVTVVP
jgi:hypothetical protein